MPGADPFSDVAAVRSEVVLARHSQFGVGGPAQWFGKVSDSEGLASLLRRASQNGVAVTVIGAGSNALILDSGIRGLVVRCEDRSLRRLDDTTVEVGAGCLLPRAALDLAKLGCAGLEFGIGVPGTCGASVRGNAGAFGAEMRDVVIDCTVLTPQGETRLLRSDELGFAYRSSRLARELADHIVVSARLRVAPDDPAAVRRRTDAIQAQRKASQPYGVRSLGSVFKNPPGAFAGRLIEAAGLKGRRSGGAEISSKHANFIVNVDHASARDVLQLVALARQGVLQRCGIALEREIVLLGDQADVALAEVAP